MSEWPANPPVGELETELDRPDALLSADDRRFLNGDPGKERSERAKEEKHRRIPKRIRNGLMDGIYLAYCLNDDDLERVFNPRRSAAEHPDDVAGGAHALLMFLYRGLAHVDGEFEGVLCGAIESVERERGWEEVEVTFGVKRTGRPVDVEDARSKFDADEELTDREIGALVRAGEFDWEDFDELVAAHDVDE